MPRLFLHPSTDKCTRCHTCTERFPMSLPVEEMVGAGAMEKAECILCGMCVDGCKTKAIEYRFE